MTSVLIVEDEESLADPLAFLLRKEGFEATVVTDGQAALAEFERAGADIVLLDLMLPGISGTDVCKQLRARSSVPVIMVTARDSEIDKVVGLELGADDYVTKPYSARELIARIRAVLRRGGDDDSEISDGVLESGPVRMDVERHVVRQTRLKCDGMRRLIVRIAIVDDPVRMILPEPCEIMMRDGIVIGGLNDVLNCCKIAVTGVVERDYLLCRNRSYSRQCSRPSHGDVPEIASARKIRAPKVTQIGVV